jgi:hypothetical protein
MCHSIITTQKTTKGNLVQMDLILSYFATYSRSVGQSVLALSPSETHDRILAIVKTYGYGRTGLSCNRTQSLSVLVIYVRLYPTRFPRVLSFP